MKHLSNLTGLANPTNTLIKARWSTRPPINTSINVATQYVYNIVDGYSLQIEENIVAAGTRYIVNMKISNDLIIRYLNLKELYIPSRYAIPEKFRIGKADGVVGIEYCTRVISNYPVRIGTFTYYKHDPTAFLLEDYLPELPLSTFVSVIAKHFELFGDGEIT